MWIEKIVRLEITQMTQCKRIRTIMHHSFKNKSTTIGIFFLVDFFVLFIVHPHMFFFCENNSQKNYKPNVSFNE